MMLDPFALPRPPRASVKVTLEHGGRTALCELKAMDVLDRHRMIALRDRMIGKYVPLAERTLDLDAEPIDFPPVGGAPVSLNEETCEACATLAVMQSTFGFEGLVALALTCPELFEELIDEAGKLNRGALKSGKGCVTSTSDSSSFLSNAGLPTTPR